MHIDKTLLSFFFLSLSLACSLVDFSLLHSFCSSCSHSKRALQNFDKNYRLSVVVKRHSSQRAKEREKKIELHISLTFTFKKSSSSGSSNNSNATEVDVRQC
jgi:hypothetical protein